MRNSPHLIFTMNKIRKKKVRFFWSDGGVGAAGIEWGFSGGATLHILDTNTTNPNPLPRTNKQTNQYLRHKPTKRFKLNTHRSNNTHAHT